MSWLTLCAVAVAVAAAVRGTWSPCGLSMVSAISPLSERARGHRYPLTCTWFVAGALGGGLLLGTGAAVGALLLRPLPAGAVAVLAAAAALVCLGSDLRVLGRHLPLHPRQVDEAWLGAYRRWVYAAGFGAQIGTGFATYVMTAATYLLAVLAALTGRPLVAVGLGLLFGLVRGLAVLLTARVRTTSDLLGLHRRLERAGPASLRLAQGSQAGVALAAGWAAGGPLGAAVVAAAAAGLLAAAPVAPRAFAATAEPVLSGR